MIPSLHEPAPVAIERPAVDHRLETLHLQARQIDGAVRAQLILVRFLAGVTREAESKEASARSRLNDLQMEYAGVFKAIGAIERPVRWEGGEL